MSNSDLITKGQALDMISLSCNLKDATNRINNLPSLMIIDNFDKGYEQALNQVLAEARVRCHRAKKNCKNCEKNNITCNTYETIKRVKDLYELGF